MKCNITEFYMFDKNNKIHELKVVVENSEVAEGRFIIATITADKISRSKIYKKWKGLYGKEYLKNIDDYIESAQKNLMVHSIQES